MPPAMNWITAVLFAVGGWALADFRAVVGAAMLVWGAYLCGRYWPFGPPKE